MIISKELASNIVYNYCQNYSEYSRRVYKKLLEWEYEETDNWVDFRQQLDKLNEEQLEALLSLI